MAADPTRTRAHTRSLRRPRHRAGRRPSRAWRIAGIVAAILVAVGVPTAIYASDVLAARDAAARMQASLGPARDAARDRDAEALSAVLVDVSGAAAEFSAHTRGSLWNVAAAVPWVQDQVRPLMAAGAAMGELNAAVIEPLTRQDLSLVEKPPIENGRVDPYVAEPFVPILADAQTVVAEQSELLGAVDLARTVDMVASGFVTLRDAMVDLGPAIETANRVLPVLPQLLAADTERTYLIMIGNNSEPRAQGGINGALIEMTIADGYISLDNYYGLQDLTNRGAILEATEEELAVFGPKVLTRNWQDMNYTPEFPRTAQIASEFWNRDFGDTPSAIISVDPVAMQYMLHDIEPITVESLTVAGDDIAASLLGEFYLAFPDPRTQDAYFAIFAESIFTQAMGGTIDLQGVARAVEDGRLRAWSPAADEEEAFTALGIDGTFLNHDDTIGVFLNETSGSKIGYYVDAHATVAATECNLGRAQSFNVGYKVTLAFDGDVEALPDYVAGGFYDTPRGRFSAWVQMYAPTGGKVTDVRIDGVSVPFEVLSHEGRSVIKLRVEVGPGESASLGYTLEGDFAPDTRLVVTPTARLNTAQNGVSVTRMACGA